MKNFRSLRFTELKGDEQETPDGNQQAERDQPTNVEAEKRKPERQDDEEQYPQHS